MALDDFKSDEDDNDTQDEQEHEEETTTEDTLSGIEAFRTSATDPSKNENGSIEEDDEFIFGLKAWRWNELDKDDRIQHVRQHYIEDYHPEYQPDDRWSYERIVEVECVCDNTFTFQTSGVCLNCGRSYKDAGRTVVKLNEVENDNSDE